jgi:hypothetical protein
MNDSIATRKSFSHPQFLHYPAEFHHQIPCQTSGNGSQVSRLAVQAAGLLVILLLVLQPGKFILATIRAGKPLRVGETPTRKSPPTFCHNAASPSKLLA